ncbi:bifunctional diaminohydroxyphosphoribosylaminopyrimidine deaminase/5-amino-6-(5-phosphoribosylamino)uracil reductase RibD [Hazenella sp. IB182357]|uniref:5-amino-6-(5-phosphoribosylamino)uracil reductase n=1 Tax=Polycladospora coralii TaxID=2771432 RepID=A0A926NI15_9BACL|nr:bifunctional diaminohydroxyphosphoribosylaminopyrimidine deaminase/5-amino-6-(5-phosphoribosylamino)uracil reductase RibD [Polycladospora coralii]MBD1373929.1 bifunctional diaminohydroxyphosphoribosylaminopyrimidine deaminase/5-amino-6-(5-phosphoribosylamino)uracil reductase RibD [Polycladospora coralii]MBS7531999.1 bifunctional diaminohydroxyphosphoribosylaminopyrimidine deaminase/5-amino-6-(5-phosphoribosylamino)uracil reductase RibD [Polycladospora coralii]
MEHENARAESVKYHKRTGLPLVTLKTAMTLDGKIATSTGDSKWVTNESSREDVHYMRHWHDAIMVGIGTVLKDRPKLTTRLPHGEGKNPIRIVADSLLRIPLDTPLVTTATETPTWVFCSDQADKEKELQLLKYDVKVVRTGSDEHVDLKSAMKYLGEKGVTSVLLEGGGQLNWSMIEASLVQKVVTFIAPKLLGGEESITPISGEGFDRMTDAVQLKNISVQKFGEDVCITGYVQDIQISDK